MPLVPLRDVLAGGGGMPQQQQRPSVVPQSPMSVNDMLSGDGASGPGVGQASTAPGPDPTQGVIGGVTLGSIGPVGLGIGPTGSVGIGINTGSYAGNQIANTALSTAARAAGVPTSLNLPALAFGPMAAAVTGPLGLGIAGFNAINALGAHALNALGIPTSHQLLSQVIPSTINPNTHTVGIPQAQIEQEITQAMAMNAQGFAAAVSPHAAAAMAHSANPAFSDPNNTMNLANPTGFVSMPASGPGATAFAGPSAGMAPGALGNTGSIFGGTLGQALGLRGAGDDPPGVPTGPPPGIPSFTDDGPTNSGQGGGGTGPGGGTGDGGVGSAGNSGSDSTGDGPAGGDGPGGGRHQGGWIYPGMHHGGPVRHPDMALYHDGGDVRPSVVPPYHMGGEPLEPGGDEDMDGRENVPAMLEAEEYVIAAPMAQQYAPLLEAINMNADPAEVAAIAACLAHDGRN